jgi:acetylornithine deacetylase/succinyl-diaminopimelate desuccinylase-like protein
MPAPASVPADLAPLLAHPAVRLARDLARATDADTLRDQLAIVRIPAPTFEEGERAREVGARMGAAGLADVRHDDAGNVLASLAGADADARPVIVSAHLDTVFPAGTDVDPREDGRRVYAPGVTDNARGLAGMLAVGRILAASRVPLARTLVFAATVGEEGRGDLRGVKHLLRDGAALRGAAAFVALDGSGIRRVVHRAIGSRRLRVEAHGPGGHSWADRGAPNPVQALGRAVAGIAQITLPAPGRTSVTVARIAGGTSVNTVPDAAWMELDLRSEVPEALAEIERLTRFQVDGAVRAENARRRPGDAPLSYEVRVIGDRPSGETDAGSYLVRAAVEATLAVGERPELVSSSTDANFPISLGIPAIAIGVGGDSGGIHTLDEWYANDRGALGVERALLVAIAAAGLAD